MKTSMFKRHLVGFTIVEIMVSLTIGLVITWAVASLFSATHLTFKTQDNSARSLESGRAAINMLAQHIRQAGFFEMTSNSKVGSFSAFLTLEQPSLLSVNGIQGCEAKKFNYGASGWPCVAAGDASDVSDSIVIAYQVQPTTNASNTQVTNLLLPVAGNPSVGRDCLGGDPTSAPVANLKGIVAINYFYIDKAKSRLMCRGNSSTTALSIADGVEDLQIQYGVNPDTQLSTSTVSYVAASAVTNWSQVVSVRLCVQTLSKLSANSKTGGSSVDYSTLTGKDCRGRDWSSTYSDGALRKAYWTTITVRNQNARVPL